jgi:hypothetical protein
VPGEVALGDETGQRGLFQHRAVYVDQPPRLQERRDQRRRQEQIADPQGGEQDLAESPAVNDN